MNEISIWVKPDFLPPECVYLSATGGVREERLTFMKNRFFNRFESGANPSDAVNLRSKFQNPW